jgi:hypothetical protein
MKTFVAFSLLFLGSLAISSANEEQVWIWDDSQPDVRRIADLWAACKISVTGENVSFAREVGGKLTEYWNASDVKAAAKVKKLIEGASSSFVQVGDGEFINIRFVTAMDFEKSSCTLRIGETTVGTVSDARKVDAVWAKLYSFPRK